MKNISKSYANLFLFFKKNLALNSPEPYLLNLKMLSDNCLRFLRSLIAEENYPDGKKQILLSQLENLYQKSGLDEARDIVNDIKENGKYLREEFNQDQVELNDDFISTLKNILETNAAPQVVSFIQAGHYTNYLQYKTDNLNKIDNLPNESEQLPKNSFKRFAVNLKDLLKDAQTFSDKKIIYNRFIKLCVNQAKNLATVDEILEIENEISDFFSGVPNPENTFPSEFAYLYNQYGISLIVGNHYEKGIQLLLKCLNTSKMYNIEDQIEYQEDVVAAYLSYGNCLKETSISEAINAYQLSLKFTPDITECDDEVLIRKVREGHILSCANLLECHYDYAEQVKKIDPKQAISHYVSSLSYNEKIRLAKDKDNIASDQIDYERIKSKELNCIMNLALVYFRNGQKYYSLSNFSAAIEQMNLSDQECTNYFKKHADDINPDILWLQELSLKCSLYLSKIFYKSYQTSQPKPSLPCDDITKFKFNVSEFKKKLSTFKILEGKYASYLEELNKLQTDLSASIQQVSFFSPYKRKEDDNSDISTDTKRFKT